MFNSYIESITDLEFSKFLEGKGNAIIHFFKNHNIQNLRTFGFYLENLSQLYKYYNKENERVIDSMLYFTAIISNEFKSGELTISNLIDKKGINDSLLYVNLDEVVGGMMGTSIIKAKAKEKKEKSYREKFIDKYLSNQNEKDLYIFSNAIYEFVLSGYLDAEKLKNEIDTRNGNSSSTEEDKAYKTLIGYNFRIL